MSQAVATLIARTETAPTSSEAASKHSPNRWHEFVRATLDQVDPNLRFIAPFGFEVLQDESYLSRPLRNFYIYLYGPTSGGGIDLEGVLDRLTRGLRKEFAPIFSRMHTIRAPGIRRAIDARGSVTLYLKQRPHCVDPLGDYIRALVAFPASASGQFLKATACFHDDPISRRYFFQLYLIFMALREQRPPPDNAHTREIKNHIRALLPIDVDADMTRNFPIRPEEKWVFENVCLPTLRAAERDLGRSGAGQLSVTGNNFHGGGELRIEVPDKWFVAVSRYVRACYNRALNH